MSVPPTIQEQINEIKALKRIHRLHDETASNKHVKNIEMEMDRLYRMGKIEDAERGPVIVSAHRIHHEAEAAIQRLVRVIDTWPPLDDDPGSKDWNTFRQAWDDCVEHGDFERGRRDDGERG